MKALQFAQLEVGDILALKGDDHFEAKGMVIDVDEATASVAWRQKQGNDDVGGVECVQLVGTFDFNTYPLAPLMVGGIHDSRTARLVYVQMSSDDSMVRFTEGVIIHSWTVTRDSKEIMNSNDD